MLGSTPIRSANVRWLSLCRVRYVERSLMQRIMHNAHSDGKGENAQGAFVLRGGLPHNPAMNLARIRKAKGLTQYDLADLIGMNQAQVVRAEKMDPSAKLATYQKCADALGVTLADLFSDSPEPVEAMLLEAFRRIPESDRSRVVAMLEIAAGPKQQGSQESGQADQG